MSIYLVPITIGNDFFLTILRRTLVFLPSLAGTSLRKVRQRGFTVALIGFSHQSFQCGEVKRNFNVVARILTRSITSFSAAYGSRTNIKYYQHRSDRHRRYCEKEGRTRKRKETGEDNERRRKRVIETEKEKRRVTRLRTYVRKGKEAGMKGKAFKVECGSARRPGGLRTGCSK